MKKILTILTFLIVSLTIQATTYYVTTAANGGSNSHTSTQAQTSSTGWLTLAYACSQVSTSGDIIHINAGTYTETAQSILAVGVNIVGAGMSTTILNSSYAGSSQPLIKAETSNGWLGTYGNQSVSGITLNGAMTTYAAINVNFRSNFIIHDCTFTNFTNHGVMFSGQPAYNFSASNPYDVGYFPSYWCSGNQFYNNTVTNCATMSGYNGDGNVRYGTQLGMLVHDNIITQTARSAGTNGYGIKFCENGFNRGTKCYNNTITIAPNVSGTFDFSIEIWNDLDECEYHNNTLQGAVDVTQAWKRNGSYGIWIHDNIMGWSSQQSHDEIGLDLEAYIVGAIVNNNKITNCDIGILNSGTWPNQDHPQNSTYSDVHIYDNLITGVGSTAGGGGIFGITWGSAEIGDNITNYYILNNTIVSSGNYGGGTYATVGIDLCDFGITANGMQIKNNIIKGFTGGSSYHGPIAANGTSSYLNLSITNNDFYGNANSNLVQWTGSFSPGTGYVNSSNVIADPLFVSSSDFHLSSNSSPAYHTGVNVSLSTDYAYNNWNNPPSIGAYEYGSVVITTPTVTTIAISSITVSAASSGGNISSDGGATVTARGVCWSTSANPTTANSKTSDGTGTGTFTSSITGLTSSTVYHVRAYATNSQGTAYGSDVQFATSAIASGVPTLTTYPITSITSSTAVTGGNILTTGGSNVTTGGVCWSITSIPTTSDSKTSDAITTDGDFISNITGLTVGTTYYVRAYAINSTGTGYGNQLSFTIPAIAPTVTTTTPSSITTTAATSGGNVTSDGGATVTTYGVCWGMSSNPTVAGLHTTDGSGTGSFASSITGLSASTIYHVRAYATNSVGTSYGSDVQFTSGVITSTTPITYGGRPVTSGGKILVIVR